MKSVIKIIAILFAIAFSQTSFAVTIAWTNTTGGNWTTAANWSPNQVPAGSDTAVITNSGTFNVTVNSAVTTDGLILGSTAAPGIRTLQITAGTLTVTNTTVMTNGTLAIIGGTLVTAGPFDSAGIIFENAGSWRLLAPGSANIFSLTNGELRGATMTVTNFTWAGANLYADAPGDKTIIPVGGTFNLVADTARYLSYYAGGFGRGIDNRGTWNWFGNCILYAYPCDVNNYGTINFLNEGAPAAYAQVGNVVATLANLNNFGVINRSLGTNTVYLGPCNLNNSGNINCQSGALAFYHGSTTNSGTVNMQNSTLMAVNSPVDNSGAVILSTNSIFQTDSGTVTFFPAGSLFCPGTNAFRINGGTVNLFSTNILAPSAWIAGGTLFHQTNNTIPVINESAGTWRMTGNQTVATYNLTNGELRGGTLTVTNCNWFNGNWYADAPGDKTIIPVGGVLNYLSPAGRVLSYYAGGVGRHIDNRGTWNWTDNSLLTAYPCDVNNYGTINFFNQGTPGTYAQFGNTIGTLPNLNNYGTITKSVGTNIVYFGPCNLNNANLVDFQGGTAVLYTGTTTNSGTINIQNGTLLAAASTVASSGDVNISANSIFQTDSGTVTFYPDASLIVPGNNAFRINGGSVIVQTTDVLAGSAWIAGGTLYHQTNNTIPVINESAGTWRLLGNQTVGIYNLTNGELRGGTLTVTNCNWFNGSWYADAPGDKTIIPPSGVLNLLGPTTRFLSYYAGGFGRNLDNYGVWNWTDNCLLAAYPAVVNNFGSVNITGQGNPGSYAQFANAAATLPVWNNFGTFTKSPGTNIFYFGPCNLNNSGAINIQSGTLALNNGVVTNLAGGAITLWPGAELSNENGNALTLQPGSILNGAAPNAVRISGGAVHARSASVTLPSLWISGGTLYQYTNLTTAVNQSGGTWQLNAPITATTYNLTNGELRGANLTVGAFNWLGGQLHSDGPGNDTVTVNTTLAISGNTAKTMSYYVQPGRSLINNGTGTWGGVGINAQGGATFRNNNSLSVTGDVALTWGGLGAVSVFYNSGTYTKTAGDGVATFGSTVITNSGTFSFNRGSLSLNGNFIQTGGASFLGTNFSTTSNVRNEAGTLNGNGTMTGPFFNNGLASPGASPGLIVGTQFTNSPLATWNAELGGTIGGTNYDQIRLTGTATLNGTLNVQYVNGFVPVLSNSFTVMTFASRSGIFTNIITPPNFQFAVFHTSTNVVLLVTGLTNAPLQITTAPTNVTVWQPDPVQLVAGVSGDAPLSYQWLWYGTNIPSATNLTYSIPTSQPSHSGPYTFRATDGNSAQTNVTVSVTVIPFDGTITWTNTAGGNWSVGANWLPSRVPGPTNTALITVAGNYTVTVNSAAAVSNLIVGATSGTQNLTLDSGQTLAVGRNAIFATNTVFGFNGTLQTTGGSNYFGGLVNWYTGLLTGPGRSVIGTNGNFFFISSLVPKYVATNILENYGSITYGNDSFGNAYLLRFSGGSQLTNHLSGIINLGANALEYAGSQTPRSYLVNFGTINTAGANPFAPSYISIDFYNYGLLYNYSYVYISRGANYGTFQWYNTLAEISVFGDEVAGEYFSFEDGTTFVGALPHLAVGGYGQWNTTAPHVGDLRVGSGSGGATFNDPEFRILKNYTATGVTTVNKGRWTMANSNLVANINTINDGIFNGFHSFVISNAGTIFINNLNHTIRNLANGGSILVRSNLALSGGATYANGRIVITNGATGAFSGGSVDAQLVENYGTNNVTGALSFTGNTLYRNRPGARTVFIGGSFVTGVAGLLNEGLVDGFGGVSGINFTNRATVLANDPLPFNRNLAVGTYIQESGVTEAGPGMMSGALDIRGGVFRGTNSVTGSVRNAATFRPGKPLGILSVSGAFTNQATGLETMVIGGTNLSDYSRVGVGGTAYLAGTLNVSFTNGFFPVVGNTFTAMTYTARSGVFDNIVLPNYQFEVIYLTNALILRASNALPVINFAIDPAFTYICNPVHLSATGTDLDGVITNVAFYMNNQPLSSVAGNFGNTAIEIDQPMTNIFEARVTDNRGGVASATQTVTWAVMPLHVLTLGGMRTNNHNFKICMVGSNGANYLVLMNTNVLTTNWAPLGLMNNFTNNIWRYYDSNATNVARYYRALIQ